MFWKEIVIGVGALGLIGTVGGTLGGYFHGIGVGENKAIIRFQLKEAAQENALDLANTKITELQTRLDEKIKIKYVDRVKTVTDTKIVNRDVIKEVYKESPYLPEGMVYAHDQLVAGAPIDPEKAANLAPSPYTWEKLFDVIAENYSIAQQGKIKDEIWNDFYDGVYHSYDDYRVQYGGSTGRPSSGDTTTSTGSADDAPTGNEED